MPLYPPCSYGPETLNDALRFHFQDNGPDKANVNQCYVELQRSLVTFIRGLPGNDSCCDCGSQNDPTWLSTNFGK